MGEDYASFGMLSTAEARQRKNVLHPLFSRRAIIHVQPLIRETVSLNSLNSQNRKANDISEMDHMAEVLIKNNENGKSADLQNAFRCYALDNITSFTFAKSYHALDEPNFASPISEAMDHQLPPFFLLKNFSLFRKLIFAMPPWLASKVSPKTAGFSKLQMSLQTLVKDVLTNPEILKETNQPTVFERLLDPEAHKGGGASIPGFKALCQEAQVQIFAGTTTVADTLMTGHFHILSQPELYRKLQAEIRTVWPDINSPPPYEVLESLPLLTATIKESLRKFPGSTNQLLRVVGSSGSGTTISGAFIPAGTVVGMSNPSVHKNSRIFPDPHKFLPERWLGEKARGLDQFLVAFSKGPRGCLGLNLAWCELYVCFATMLRRFEMVLDETREEDVDMWLPFSLPWYYGRHLKVCCCPVED